MQFFLTPHQLADKCETTKRTVLFYDEKRILIPKLIDEKGFRKYTSQQITHLKLLLLLQTSNVSIDQIYKYLKQTNYSYLKLYKKYENLLQEITSTINQHLKEIDHSFNKFINPTTKFELKTIHETNYYSLETFIKPNDSFKILEKIQSYFDNFPLMPIFIIEFKASPTPDEERVIHIGISKENRLKPKDKFRDLFTLKTINSQKAYSRTFLMKKNDESNYLNKLNNYMNNFKPTISKALLVLHDREPTQKQYIFESNLLL
jgi:DNA-binding transcriptional MerR regulator